MRWLLPLLGVVAVCTACTPLPKIQGDKLGPRVPLFINSRESPDPTISLPASLTLQESPGVDAPFARITGPGIVVNVNMGRTGGSQRCDSLPECEAGSLNVHGRPASWVLFRMTNPSMVQGWPFRLHYWIKLYPQQDPRQGPVSGLLYSAGCANREVCRSFIAIASTTRFYESRQSAVATHPDDHDEADAYRHPDRRGERVFASLR